MGAGNDAMATLPVLTDKYYPDNPENISRIIASIWHIPQKRKKKRLQLHRLIGSA